MFDSTRRNSVSGCSFSTSKELIDYCKPIRQGWYRCQAIAGGAAKLNRDQCRKACIAAAAAAKAEKDQYRRVAVLAWPIQTMFKAGLVREANSLLEYALEESKSVVPSNSRAYALGLLCEHAWDMNESYRRSILATLYEMIDSIPGWRIARECDWITKKLDRAGDAAFVDGLLKDCTNDWLHGRIERDRAKRLANKDN